MATVTVHGVADIAKVGERWSVCGVRIHDRSKAIMHAANCCPVGVVSKITPWP